MTKKTWTYGASLTPAERRAWNAETDRILARRVAGPRRPECNGPVHFERDVLVDEPYVSPNPPRDADPLRRKRIAKLVVFCCRCEFAKEL